jgi:hypothetical protein
VVGSECAGDRTYSSWLANQPAFMSGCSRRRRGGSGFRQPSRPSNSPAPGRRSASTLIRGHGLVGLHRGCAVSV